MIQTMLLTAVHSPRFILLIGDLIALLLFVYVGQVDHGIVNARPILGLLTASWEFALLWVGVGWLLGAFPRTGEWTTRSLFTRPLVAWLVVAPLALLLRALVLGRLNIPTLFLAATLGFGLLFIFAWRLLFMLGWQAAKRRIIGKSN